MPNEIIPIETPPPLDIPDPRPYIIGTMAATALIATVISRLLKHRSDGAVWGMVSATVSGVRPPRQWTSAFSESDGFLAQLKNITPTEAVKNS